MMKKIYLNIFAVCAIILSVSAQNKEKVLAFDNYHRYYNEAIQVHDNEKEKAIKNYRVYYSEHAYRGHSMVSALTVREILKEWREDGTFSDILEKEKQIIESGKQDETGLFLTEAFNRIWKVAEEFRADRMGISIDKDVFRKCQKAIEH